MTTIAARSSVLLTIFLFAGAPALVYQVVWQRALSLYFGVDIYSTTITVSVFMAGLGLGSLIGGRLADRTRHLALAYALVELGIGAVGLVSLDVIAAVGAAMPGAPMGRLLLINGALLLVPTMLMGMTLPLMIKLATTRFGGAERMISLLYGINTLGAACGALLTAYLLLGLAGFEGAVRLAAALNIALAVLVLIEARWGRRRAGGPAATSPAVADDPRTDARRSDAPWIDARRADAVRADLRRAEPRPRTASHAAATGPSFVVLGGFMFASGFVAIGFEIVLYRVVGIVLHGTVYVFGTHLAVFLLGIAGGSLAARRRIARPGRLRRFGLSQVVIALYTVALACLLGHGSMLPGVRHLLAGSFFTYFHPSLQFAAGQYGLASIASVIDIFLWTGLLVLPLAWCMGYGFPNLLGEGTGRPDRLGRSVGSLYLANIVGSALGGLVTGFVLLHRLGTERTLLLLAVASLVIGLLAMRRESRGRDAKRLPSPAFAALVAVAALGAAAVFPRPLALIRALHVADTPKVEFEAIEDRTGVVALRTQGARIAFAQEDSIIGPQRLYIDGSTHGFTSEFGEARDPETLVALAALDAPRRALSIGLGDARMPAAAAAHPDVRELVVVELKESLARILESTAQGEELARNADKVRHVIDDGRRWLLANPDERFDLIMMFPLHAAHAHSGSLYSREFFELLVGHLTPGGVVFLKSADFHSTARTLVDAFDSVVRLGRQGYVASNRPVRFRPDPASGLSREMLLSAVSAGDALLREATREAPPNTDFAPNSEFYLTYPYRADLIPGVPLPFGGGADEGLAHVR